MISKFILLAIFLSASQTLPVQSAATTHRVFQIDNSSVVAWKTTIEPGQPLRMHRHERDRVVVVLRGGTLTKVESDGKKSPLIFATGQTYWLPADPPGTMHADLNEGPDAVETVVIELKTNPDT